MTDMAEALTGFAKRLILYFPFFQLSFPLLQAVLQTRLWREFPQFISEVIASAFRK